MTAVTAFVLSPDALAFAASVLLLLAYRSWVHHLERKRPGRLVHAMNARVRSRWVETVMSDGKRDVLAIQTLRNSVMAASFMASTAVLLVMGTLTLTANMEPFTRFWGSTLAAELHPTSLWALKLGVLLGDIFLAFFQFSMAIRFFNHVGYMINVAPERRDESLSPAFVAAALNRAGRYYSMGMRLFYFCMPLALWLLGPAWLLVGTLGLIVALWRLDHNPGV